RANAHLDRVQRHLSEAEADGAPALVARLLTEERRANEAVAAAERALTSDLARVSAARIEIGPVLFEALRPWPGAAPSVVAALRPHMLGEGRDVAEASTTRLATHGAERGRELARHVREEILRAK